MARLVCVVIASIFLAVRTVDVQSVDSCSHVALALIQTRATLESRAIPQQCDETSYLFREPSGDTMSFMLVLPSAKLAFCAIPKVASTDFAEMFTFANGGEIKHGGWRTWTQKSTGDALGLGISDISKENGWKFDYFVRDPLERYLSAFQSKCLPGAENGATNCCGEPVMLEADISTYVEAFENRVLSDAQGKPEFRNPHWMTQTHVVHRHCGWRDQFDPDSADFIELLSDDVHDKVKDMLMKGNVTHFKQLADKFFPRQGEIIGTHATSTRSDFETYYKNKTIAQAVVELYKEDYRTFKLPRPEFCPAKTAGRFC